MIQWAKKIVSKLGPRVTSRISYHHYNERDIEIPSLLEFMEGRAGKFFSLLDVGAYGSHAYYAPSVRKRFPDLAYDGIDIRPDPKTAKILTSYKMGNVTDIHLGPYDMIICVSTIQCCGVSVYKRDDYRAEQLAVFRRACGLAKKFIFASFPYGQEGEVPGEYCNITPGQLQKLIDNCGGKARKRFYFNEFPQGRRKWVAISEEKASMVPLRQERGVQCICVLEIEKPMAHLQGDFHGISDFLLKRTRLLQPQAEYTPGREDYTMFNTGGVELEVGEFLYAFVKMVKPKRILETGTHLGISAMYMAQALKENKGGGKVITLEIFDENIQKSKALWRDTQVEGLIEVHKRSSLEFETSEMFDMLFLDSEPDIRFDELNRFYSKLKPGGFIVIHDLHVNLGLSNLFINGMHNWPFGDFREKFGGLLKDFSLQTFTFRTPRGLVMFQKADKDFSHTAYMRASKAEEMPQ